MRLAPMAAWRPVPGRVLTVRPTPASRAAGLRASVHPGEPSMLQEDHLRAYAGLAARGGEHRAWTGVGTEVDGPLDRESLVRALVRFVGAHEGLRSWFDVSGPDPVRHLLAPEDVDFEVVEAGELHGPDWQASLQEHMTQLFSAQCRPDAWPGFALGVVEGPESFALFWGCDHAFTDGGSQIMLASELAALYAGEDVPAAGSFLDRVAEERAAAPSYPSDSPEVAGWLDIVAAHGRTLPTFPLDLGLEPGETAPVRVLEVDLLDVEQVDDLDTVCKESGARLTGGVFAAVAHTEQLLAGNEDYFGLTVLSTRGAQEHARAQGWYCAFAPVAFRVAGADSFGALARAAQDGLDRGRDLSVAPVHTVLHTLVSSGTTPASGLGSPQLVSYIDLRWFPGVGDPAHERGVHFTGEGRTANASMWINRDRDRLYLVAQTPDTPTAQEAVASYHRVLRDVLVAAGQGRLLEPAHARHDD